MNTIMLEKHETIVICTIHRPAQLNAINTEVLLELQQMTREISQDASVRCLIIRGAGEKAFAAGADIAEMAQMGFEGAKQFVQLGCGVLQQIEDLRVPVIAAINGYAFGGGFELALACDIRLASEHARLGLPETSLGIMPGFHGAARLCKLIGYANAAELVFTAQQISAQAALEKGIVNRLLPTGELMDAALSIASKISENAPVAIRNVKRSMKKKEDAYQDNLLFAECFLTQDQKKGMRSFINKEKREAYLGE